jgi:hypothetical protein
MRTTGQSHLSAGLSPGKGPGPRTALLIVAMGVGLGACHQPSGETPQAKARPGEVLVRSGQEAVTLVKPFRQGEPNGLFDGVVSVGSATEGTPALMEINAICSLPGEPGWPAYDNLYGRVITRAEEAQGPTGETQWQILFNFSGSQDVRMGQKPGPWVDRLRENLCRRGSFDDRPKKQASKAKR